MYKIVRDLPSKRVNEAKLRPNRVGGTEEARLPKSDHIGTPGVTTYMQPWSDKGTQKWSQCSHYSKKRRKGFCGVPVDIYQKTL